MHNEFLLLLLILSAYLNSAVIQLFRLYLPIYLVTEVSRID